MNPSSWRVVAFLSEDAVVLLGLPMMDVHSQITLDTVF